METLRLPPGPGRLWKQIRTAVRHYLRHHDGRPAYEIGGGTSTAQILHGKLMRADESPARDVYDVVTAGRLDARSLEEAGRIEGARHLRNTARLWIAQNALITGEARQSITTMDGEPARQVDDLGIEGARVLNAIADRLEHDGRPGARLPGD